MINDTTHTLANALPHEIQRVQELIPLYESIPTGIFAARMMRASINTAHQAMMAGDVVAMLQSLNDLKGFKE